MRILATLGLLMAMATSAFAESATVEMPRATKRHTRPDISWLHCRIIIFKESS